MGTICSLSGEYLHRLLCGSLEALLSYVNRLSLTRLSIYLTAHKIVLSVVPPIPLTAVHTNKHCLLFAFHLLIFPYRTAKTLQPLAVPNVTTRRAAQSARIQTRGMLREQHNKDRERQQQTGAIRKPNAALQAAKQRAKELQLQQQQQQNNAQHLVKDIYQTAMDAQQLVRSATGLVYDERMAEHRCLWDEEFPECPERFTRVLER